MENASKALLIAAGVLIVIIIIAISIKIFNSVGDVATDSDGVGQAIKSESYDASKKALFALEDLKGKSLTNIPEVIIKTTNSGNPYGNYFPSNPPVVLEPNTTYTLSFDYEVLQAPTDTNIGCGIGVR